MSTDPTKLTAAADRWEELAGKFRKLEDQYEREVHAVAKGTVWSGLSAEAAKLRFDATLNEYRAAQKEAKALASLLRGAHTQLADLRNRLKTLRDDAVKNGMRVSDQGVVSYDYDRLDQSARTALAHDPSYQESVRSAVGEWDKAIKQAVKAVGEADAALAIGLKTVVADGNALDGTMAGFNSAAQGDFRQYEAEEKERRAERAAEADAAAKEKAEADKPADSTTASIIRGIASGLNSFARHPDGLGGKALTGLVEGVLGGAGYNSTQGISFNVGVGWGGAGVGYEVSLAHTQTPDGDSQFGLLTSKSVTSSGLDFGFSGGVGAFKSNADDITQLEGMGWDKGASVNPGVGLWGNHQTAIGTENSTGDPVGTFTRGLGLGVGAEFSSGYSEAKIRRRFDEE
ncbi:hypothetical protein RCO28_36280 [Streptomyces sp. LHD-70]|uniref:hypothetical protein n=1 Tax=Streptomyces sp. LHD-70 TaxID=3072140 RepID=UPI00280CF86E|nr:hypothetical protein [Streptomyces sp. LHD-70]MDQ8707888.1 hypothetical protein [Streptomyces sp. LHD-70]